MAEGKLCLSQYWGVHLCRRNFISIDAQRSEYYYSVILVNLCAFQNFSSHFGQLYLRKFIFNNFRLKLQAPDVSEEYRLNFLDRRVIGAKNLQKQVESLVYNSTLKMEVLFSSEAPGSPWNTRPYNSEDGMLQSYCRENLRSNKAHV
jgi:hypothetical protein